MNTAAAKPPAWDMIETLTKARLVVPPLGGTDPDQITAFGEWHWGTRALDRLRELYLFDVEAVARNIIDHGPLFALSHGGHGINSYALSLLTTAPTGDVVYFTQHGFGGGYSDEDRQIVGIDAAHQEVARLWEELDDGTRYRHVRWLVFSSFMRNETGIIDLDALRDGAESAIERIDHNALFDELKARRAAAAPPPPPVLGVVPHLAEALRRLEGESHLVIGIHGSIRYVQFATFRPNLRLETIGPRYLEEGGELAPVDELVWLADRGWHDADDGGNLWQEWIPADEDAAAAAAVEALVGVHGVTDVEQVWFYSGDDNALDAFDDYVPPTPALAPTTKLQPTSPLRAAAINAALNEEPLRLPSGSKIVAVVDYVARTAVLELLALVGDEVVRRHASDWREDPQWRKALPKAPARSIVPLTQEQLDKVLTQVDGSTAGKPWKPFKVSDLERYWPSHRPNDPDLFDWSQLDSFGELHEP